MIKHRQLKMIIMSSILLNTLVDEYLESMDSDEDDFTCDCGVVNCTCSSDD